MPSPKQKLVGSSVPRKEGRDKVTGRARYVDDLTFPGLLHGVTVRSQVPRGIIRKIEFGAGIPWGEFTIVTARDIPGENCVLLIEHDQPLLADGAVNHPEEAILLLAHPDPYLLEEARRAVSIEIELLPPIFTLEDSLARKEIIWGADNVFKSYAVNKGDVDPAFARADCIVVEDEYRTGAQEQLYIEPQGMISIANPQDGVTVWGSMQCPYYIHKALAAMFGLPADKIRVVQAETGGGFGGKEEYPSMIAGHAALLAWKSGRPVKIIYDRAEDMAATTKRHPSRTRHRSAVTRDGKLLAMDIDFALDGGAYATLSSVVLSRGTIHAAGPYFCPNVRIRSRVVATNAPPHGAFRGFGAPQSIFALELHMDRIAHAIGLSPEEFRRRNFIAPGQTTATGQVIHEAVDMNRLLDRALRESDYSAKRERFARENPAARVKKGIGFAAFFHGAGFTGSGETYLASVVEAEATADGRVRVMTSNTEMGQGANTVFAQIAADALGLDYAQIEIVQPDTAAVPNSGPTVASRTSMVVGKLVETAALSLKHELESAGLLTVGGDPDEDFARAARTYIGTRGPLRARSQYRAPPGLHWDDATYSGDAYGAFAWAVYVAEVSVDIATFETHVDDFTAVQEVGKVIHPVLAAGQIEGGIAQGIGYALTENVVWQNGGMANGQMTNYIMPTAADLPRIRVFFEENPYAFGPGGAKGIGELPIDGPAPAILNAIENATGLSIREIPATPERIMQAFDEAAPQMPEPASTRA
ncbi:MAG: xanthine dehydrogenase family protein molybdopterin-binding subunit [Candidatus Acidiferrales bacterium]